MGRGSSGSSCIAILNQNLSHNFCGSVIQAWLSSLLFRISQGCSSLDLQSNVRLLSSVFIGGIPFLPSEYWSPWILDAALSFLTGISNGIPFNMELCFQSSIKVSSKLVKFKGLHGVYMQIWGAVPFSGYYPYHFSSSTRPKFYSLWARRLWLLCPHGLTLRSNTQEDESYPVDFSSFKNWHLSNFCQLLVALPIPLNSCILSRVCNYYLQEDNLRFCQRRILFMFLIILHRLSPNTIPALK